MNSVRLILIGLLIPVMGCKNRVEVLPRGSVSSKEVRPYNSPVAPVDAEKLQISVATDVFQEAKLIEPHEEPDLPPGWETRLNYPLRLVLRVLINERGNVTEMEIGPLEFARLSESFNECYPALRQAVMHWKFAPAVRARVRPGENGRPVITSQKETDTALYFEFLLTPNRVIQIQQRK